jgi:hypothetical protein
MTRISLFRLTAACLIASFSRSSVATAAVGKKNDVVGSIWSYTIVKGDKTDKGTFRVYRLDIYKGEKKVGRVTVLDKDETKLSITEWPEMNGKALLKKNQGKNSGATGTMKKTDGTDWHMTVHFKDG